MVTHIVPIYPTTCIQLDHGLSGPSKLSLARYQRWGQTNGFSTFTFRLFINANVTWITCIFFHFECRRSAHVFIPVSKIHTWRTRLSSSLDSPNVQYTFASSFRKVKRMAYMCLCFQAPSTHVLLWCCTSELFSCFSIVPVVLILLLCLSFSSSCDWFDGSASPPNGPLFSQPGPCAYTHPTIGLMRVVEAQDWRVPRWILVSLEALKKTPMCAGRWC